MNLICILKILSANIQLITFLVHLVSEEQQCSWYQTMWCIQIDSGQLPRKSEPVWQNGRVSLTDSLSGYVHLITQYTTTVTSQLLEVTFGMFGPKRYGSWHTQS